MFDLGWSELLVIGVVALIVVGPKDLPMMFRKLGEFTGRARAMAREFSSAMDKAADESGVNDIKRDLRTMSKGINTMSNPRKMGLDALNKATEGLDADLGDTPPNKPAMTPPVSAARPTAAAPDASAAQAPAADSTTAPARATPAPATDDRPA